MPTISESLSKLSDSMAELSRKAKAVEDRTTEARTQTHEQLESQIAEARATAERQRQELKRRGAEAKDEMVSSWADLRSHVHAQLDKMRANIKEHRAEHEANVAERRAERAEIYALDAVDFVYDALAEAEAAVLEAIDLRAIADAKAA